MDNKAVTLLLLAAAVGGGYVAFQNGAKHGSPLVAPEKPNLPPARGQLLIFISGDCIQCRRMQDNLSLVKLPVPVKWINVDRDRAMARSYKVRNPPVLIRVDDFDREISRTSGHLSVVELCTWLHLPVPQTEEGIPS